jgi:hypothetical protein
MAQLPERAEDPSGFVMWTCAEGYDYDMYDLFLGFGVFYHYEQHEVAYLYISEAVASLALNELEGVTVTITFGILVD